MVSLILYNKKAYVEHIPIKEFKTIEECDSFTMQFENDEDLIDGYVQNGHDLEKKYSSVGIVVSNKNRLSNIQPVAYSEDYFDKDDVFNKFLNYYAKNQSKVLDWEIGMEKVIITRGDERVFLGDSVEEFTEKDLAFNVNIFLNSKGKPQYKKYRDVYFKLKELGIKVKTYKIPEVSNSFPNIETNDEFLSDLLEYAKLKQAAGEDISDLEDEYMGLLSDDDFEATRGIVNKGRRK